MSEQVFKPGDKVEVRTPFGDWQPGTMLDAEPFFHRRTWCRTVVLEPMGGECITPVEYIRALAPGPQGGAA